jgi:hypothetical protein
MRRNVVSIHMGSNQQKLPASIVRIGTYCLKATDHQNLLWLFLAHVIMKPSKEELAAKMLLVPSRNEPRKAEIIIAKPRSEPRDLCTQLAPSSSTKPGHHVGLFA